jgi:hypothetical protein
MPPRAILASLTAGDTMVPTSTGYAFARAAGAVPFLPPAYADTHAAWAAYATPRALWDALGGRTPNELLVENHVVEGLARLGRTQAGLACTPNYTASATCTTPPAASECTRALYDADWLAEGKNAWDAPHPPQPLRLARASDVRATDTASLLRAWEPRLRGVPLAAEDRGFTGTSPLVAVANAWLHPAGAHVFVNGDPCKKFDDVVYHDHLVARFLATQGKDLYYLSHPTSHTCLERESCPFFP